MPTGVAVAAAVGSAVVTGVTPLPIGGRNLAIEPGLQNHTDAAAKATSAAVRRILPGTTSRDTEKAKPKPGPTATKTTKKPKPPQNPWTCAVSGCVGPMVSGFGPRYSPGGIGSTYHRGDDFAIAWGTPLHAMHAGRVISAGWMPGFGIHVTIDYGGGVQIIFGHMSRVQVAPGQLVARGQVVGHSGDTGISTGPHLHLEIHLNGVAINPTPWLIARGIY